MKTKVMTFENTSVGDVTLPHEIFGLPVRRDILARMVRYQLAKRRAGTHKVKGRSEIACTGAKSVAQKGSGGARHHARSAGIFVGGGRAFGPKPRSYTHKLPKKVRTLALKTALSAKVAGGDMLVVEDVVLSRGKTKDLRFKLQKMGIESALIVGGTEVNINFALAARNLAKVDVLPVQGANVYDILRRKTLVLSKSAIETLESRLK